MFQRGFPCVDEEQNAAAVSNFAQALTMTAFMCTGVQLLMRYNGQGYAEALTTDQCNVFLRLCVADMKDNGIYPAAVQLTTMLIAHMADVQQPAPDMTWFSLVLDSMLLSLDQPSSADVPEQATKVLLSLYSSFLPLLHSQFSTSTDTCVVYTQMMAAFRCVHDLPAAFQVSSSWLRTRWRA